MLIKNKQHVFTSSEITSEHDYSQRREFLRQLAAGAASLALPSSLLASECQSPKLSSKDPLTSLQSITRYNNYYEFSTNKRVIFELAKALTLRPWSLTIEGEVENPYTIDIEDLLSDFTQEERIYRLRCVEGWAAVIPWQGIPLCKLLNKAAPTSRAKYVEFVSLHRPAEMIGQRRPTLDWPYREGLRIDEARHPLTLLVTGLYGKDLPPQNGAPIRLAVPWKYAFKSAKAITHIRLVEKQPVTSWHQAAPSEYGFYANVNPTVAHPRWTQSRENRIGELRKRPTDMFNGYAEQVAGLYRGMDLRKFY
ncbi:MAG: protein-methionine-sulfoxide reductase catalytic subunit MsrP [Gammaproteobacteria bacterium]|nr:protein-methionine-sulfoxide reductase catalytic subunit MsrP [Gammaproteobacteria bacterium]